MSEVYKYLFEVTKLPVDLINIILEYDRQRTIYVIDTDIMKVIDTLTGNNISAIKYIKTLNCSDYLFKNMNNNDSLYIGTNFLTLNNKYLEYHRECISKNLINVNTDLTMLIPERTVNLSETKFEQFGKYLILNIEKTHPFISPICNIISEMYEYKFDTEVIELYYCKDIVLIGKTDISTRIYKPNSIYKIVVKKQLDKRYSAYLTKIAFTVDNYFIYLYNLRNYNDILDTYWNETFFVITIADEIII